MRHLSVAAIVAASTIAFTQVASSNGRFSLIARLLVLAAGCLTLANCTSGNMADRVAATADAKHRYAHHRAVHDRIVCNERGCSDYVNGDRPEPPHLADAYDNGSILGSRPAGCPHSFCGCEASRYVFGRIRPELNLASNWMRKFPRSSPAPGMAAVRNHHVMVLVSHVGGSDWLVHDGNSGGGLTRDHVRSISGYIVVNPNGT